MIAQQHTSKAHVIDNEDFTLAEGLRAYGYLLDPRRDPDCWLWLKGMIADDLLPASRRKRRTRASASRGSPQPVNPPASSSAARLSREDRGHYASYQNRK